MARREDSEVRAVVVRAMAVSAASLCALAAWVVAARVHLIFEQVAVRWRKVEVWAMAKQAAMAMAVVA